MKAPVSRFKWLTASVLTIAVVIMVAAVLRREVDDGLPAQDVPTKQVGGLPQGVSGLLGAGEGARTRRAADGSLVLQYDATSLERAPQLRLAPVPLAIMGAGDTGEFDLTGLRQARVLRDGRVVTYALGGHILVFGADGRGERRIGRKGMGPGELQAPTGIASMKGDSVVLLDLANRRIVLATAGAGIVRERSLPRNMSLRPDQVAGVLPGGEIVLYERQGPWPQVTGGDPVPSRAAVAVLRPDDEVIPVATLDVGSFVRRETRYRGRKESEVAFVRFSPLAHVAVWDSLIVTSTGRDYRLDLRDGSGRILGMIEVDRPRRPVTAATRRAAVDWEIGLLRNISEPMRDSSESERLIREAPYADTLPALFSVQVAMDNTLWVVDAIAPGDSSWTATKFRLDGSVAGRLHAASADWPLAFGEDRVLMRHVGKDGVVTLRAYKTVGP